MGSFDDVVDVVIVGSGSAAMTAALAVKEAGKEPLVLESTELYGGSSAMSGGGLWIPNNPVMREAGVDDSYEKARTYMDTVIGDVGPASSPERRDAFLRHGPEMVAFLRRRAGNLRFIRDHQTLPAGAGRPELRVGLRIVAEAYLPDHADQVLQAGALFGRDGNDRRPQQPGEQGDINAVPLAGHLIHHIQSDHQRPAQLFQLQREIQVPLKVGRVHDVHHDVRLFFIDVVPGDDFLHGIRG